MSQSNLPARRGYSAPAASSTALSPNDLAPILIREARRHRVALVGIFAAVALLTLAVGLLVLPKNYVASTTILAQESDIIQPLLEGRAVATEVVDRAGIARQVIYSRKVLEDAMKTGGWLEDKPSAIEQDRLMEQIKGRIAITSPRPNLIQITYRDSDAKRT